MYSNSIKLDLQKLPKNQQLQRKKKQLKKVRKQERFKEIKNLDFNKESFVEYFKEKDFDNSRIVDVEVEQIAGPTPKKMVTFITARGGKEVEETPIEVSNDSQLNNLLKQLSDTGPTPNDLPIFN